MTEFLMPKLGADMTVGKLIQWQKRPGDAIRRGDVIAVIETDKTNIDVESFQAGLFEQILVEPSDEWLPVGTPLALIHEEGEEAALPTRAAPPPPSAAPVGPPTRPVAVRAVAPAATERLRVSPAARKHAEDLGLDLGQVTGTGPGGRITLEDVQQAAAKRPAAPPAAAPSEDKAARMRQAIARAMARSKREIPHYYLSHTIDMAPALTWLTEANLQRPVTARLLYGALLVKAVALALREFPELNSWWVDERAERRHAINIGVAVSLRGGGLVAPALLDADKRSLDEIMQNLQDLVQRARAGSLRSSEYTEPTITVTNLGERGVETVFGVIFPPQVALLGFGKIMERPWVADGQIVSRPLITATLSADHRVSDGHRGALFLAAIERLLREPERL